MRVRLARRTRPSCGEAFLAVFIAPRFEAQLLLAICPHLIQNNISYNFDNQCFRRALNTSDVRPYGY